MPSYGLVHFGGGVYSMGGHGRSGSGVSDANGETRQARLIEWGMRRHGENVGFFHPSQAGIPEPDLQRLLLLTIITKIAILK